MVQVTKVLRAVAIAKLASSGAGDARGVIRDVVTQRQVLLHRLRGQSPVLSIGFGRNCR
jgi:hypothetical protein